MFFLRDQWLDAYKPGSLAWRLRTKRFELFQAWLDQFPRPLSILDVGGTMSFWKSMGVEHMPDIHITLLNLEACPTDSPTFTSLAGDAAYMPQFEDREFDIVFSNSVIEHVGNDKRQIQMAREIQRVGKAYFVQTPNLFFPIEAHFYFPWFQFMPIPMRALLLYYFDLTGGGISRTVAAWKKRLTLQKVRRLPCESWGTCLERVKSVRLFSRKKFQRLFPDSLLYEEKCLGLTKSFIAYTRPKSDVQASPARNPFHHASSST